MEHPLAWATIGTGLFIVTHLLAGRFHTLVGPQKRPLHSVLTGITTAYLFLKLLPRIGDSAGFPMGSAGLAAPSNLVLSGIALAGFISYYAVEVRAYTASSREGSEAYVYRGHLAVFAVFNAFAAFLLPYHFAQGTAMGITYVVAIVVHLLVLDHALAEVHQGLYGLKERTIHSAGLLSGLSVAAWLGSDPSIVTPVLAFFAGAIALQVIREEVPEHKMGHPGAFALGAGIFTALLLAAELLDSGGL
jgi:hypothetical protein